MLQTFCPRRRLQSKKRLKAQYWSPLQWAYVKLQPDLQYKMQKFKMRNNQGRYKQHQKRTKLFHWILLQRFPLAESKNSTSDVGWKRFFCGKIQRNKQRLCWPKGSMVHGFLWASVHSCILVCPHIDKTTAPASPPSCTVRMLIKKKRCIHHRSHLH